AQHVHDVMITQQTAPAAQCLLQAAGRREPETLCGEAFSSRAMAVLHDSDTRLTTSLPPPTGPEPQDHQLLCWSLACWSPPPESNRRPHPYHSCCRAPVVSGQRSTGQEGARQSRLDPI